MGIKSNASSGAKYPCTVITAGVLIGPESLTLHTVEGTLDCGELPTTKNWKELIADWLPEAPRYFGRFPFAAKAACLAGAMLLKIRKEQTTNFDDNRPVGIIGMGTVPTQMLNEEFFRDYIEAGRNLARAGLFIYTLPTSPLAEASIALGLTGPIYFIEGADEPATEALREAEDMVSSGYNGAMMVFRFRSDSLAALLVEPDEINNRGQISFAQELLNWEP